MKNALTAVALLLAVAACGPADSGSLGPAPQGSPVSAVPASAQPSPPRAPGQAAAPVRNLTLQVWLVRGNRLFAVQRTRPAEITTGRLALSALVDGPTSAERAAGVRTAIAAGSEFGLSLSGGVATVVPPAGFYSGGRDAARLRQAQVVCTLTQYPTIRSVYFDTGHTEPAAPVARAAYAGLIPAIAVVSPAIGARVTSPVIISGSADVYEATVSVRILSEAGTEIATRFTSASAGTGTRGTYSVAVPFSAAREQDGTVEVFEVSARDGTRVNSVRIPVRLMP